MQETPEQREDRERRERCARLGAIVTREFDPDQPRDEKGEWSAGGGGGTPAEKPLEQQQQEFTQAKEASLAALKDNIKLDKGAPVTAINKAIETMAARGMSPEMVRAVGFVRVYGMQPFQREGATYTTQGSYNHDYREIQTRASAETFIHEYGHHLTMNMSSRPEGYSYAKATEARHASIAEWERVIPGGAEGKARGNPGWQKMSAADARKVPSAYATLNFKEWQAESFRMYMAGGAKEARLQKVAPATHAYIDGLVRNTFK